MASQPPYRSQEQQRTEQQRQNAPPLPQSQNVPPLQQAQTAQTFEAETIVLPDVKQQAGKAPGPKLEEPVVAAGTTGEHNIKLQRFEVPMPYGASANFKVTTAPGNGLEVTMQQLGYKKSFTGTGALQTAIIPQAPIGTKGKITARDTTTGETYEQPWTWILMGGFGGGLGLWAMIKKLFVKSDAG